MPPPYALTHLDEIEDSAAGFGIGDTQEARSPSESLETERTGLSLHRLHPGKRPAFAHRHENAEEVYVVLSGAGRVKLEDDTVEIGRLDAIRVAPEVTRAFEAGPDGLEMLAFGPRVDGDGEIVRDWWTD